MQRFVTVCILLFFFLLLTYGLIISEPNKDMFNSLLPIVTGWLGAIIAFYFSKGFSSAMENSLRGVRGKIEQQALSLQEMENQIKDKDKQIEEMAAEYKNLESEALLLSKGLRIIQNIQRKKRT
jgi:TRAP-type C4-dicarboxylate transport system permease small subunit